MIEESDLKPYIGQHVRIGVPNDLGFKQKFCWFGILLDVSHERIKIKTNRGETMFIRFDQILDFSTLRERQ